jgi:WW domain-containing oxidoreductase
MSPGTETSTEAKKTLIAGTITAEAVAAAVSLSGRVAVVTGATSGIGLETAQVLAGRGARVVLGCRSLENGAAAAKKIRTAHPGAFVEPVQLDLTSRRSTTAFAKVLKNIYGLVHILVCNAGVFGLPYTKSGGIVASTVETTFATNHLGHFLLCELLLDLLKAGANSQGRHSRVVVVSDESHRRAGEKLNLDKLSKHQASTYTAWVSRKAFILVHFIVICWIYL